MKRFVVLSFAILICAACGGAEGAEDIDDTGGKPGKPRPGKPNQDAGASVDAGDASDATMLAADGGPGEDTGTARPDASSPDAGTSTGDASAPGPAFDGRWTVTLRANRDTTCTNPASYESQILDTWTFTGATLMGDHLGPNPYAREPGADVWSTGGETIAATADLELVGAKDLRGVFVFYRDLCDVFYDVTGTRAP